MMFGWLPFSGGLLDDSGEIIQTELGRGVAGLTIFVTAALCTPRNRGRLHRWLGSLGASGTQAQLSLIHI